MRTRRPGLRRRGAVAVLVTMCLVPLVTVLALVLDGGILMGQRRLTQAGADAAAQAAAYSLHVNYGTNKGADPLGKAKTIALALALDNGFSNDVTTSTVTVNIPPTVSTTFSGKSGYAEVIVQYQQKRYFSAILGSGTMPVYARAVARASDIIPSSGATVYSTASIVVLDPTAAGALTLAGSAVVTAAGGIQVNSSNAGAVNSSNAGYASSPSIKVVGGYTFPYGTSSTWYSSQPQIGQAAVADPLASLASPSSTGLTSRSIPGYNASIALSPGLYSSGMNFSANGGTTYTLSPGTYFVHGSLNIANGVTVNGTGVTFLVDNSGGSVTIGGGAKVNLTSSSSGTYAGMLLYQDRSNTNTINIANGSTTSMTGTIYAAGATVALAGGSSNSQYGSQLIAKQVNASNNASFTVNTIATGSAGTINVANYAPTSTAAASAVVE
jgi:Flp pilus assembly protein TadG